MTEEVTAPASSAGDTPGVVQDTTTVEAGTTEQAAVTETEEQKNERVVREREERSKRALNGVQRRINELTERAKDAERREAMAIGLAERALGHGKPAPQTQADREPTRDQFGPYEDFVAARAEHRAERKIAEAFRQRDIESQQRTQESNAQQSAERIRRDYGKRVADYAKTDAEFAQVVARDDIEVPESVAALLQFDEAPGPLLKAFGRNPELLSQFEGKSFPEQALLLGRLSESLKARSPQVSNAPTPGKPVSAKSSAADSEPSDSDSMDEWLRKREAKLKVRK